MGIVKYTKDRTFNIGEAFQDGWGKDWESEKALIGLKLQDRKKPKRKATISNVDWSMGTFRVWFKGGGWLCFDHAIEQFKCIS